MTLGELKLNDEEGRLRALERLEILDTGKERPFEAIVTLVEQVLSVPLCAVSLVDRNRQWFKAKRGLTETQTARDISFCTYTIEQTDAFIVPDAKADPRFASSPLVVSGNRIASYAGIPLKTLDGYNIGALCAMDTKPREFKPHEIEILSSFAKMVINEIELLEVATHDQATGALRRQAWIAKSEAELKRSLREARPLSLVILDIDKFKSVNDTYGHPAGDLVISKLADTCMENLRDYDIFGRYGGEEFIALLPASNLDEAVAVAEKCRRAFEASRTDVTETEAVRCTVSVGISLLRSGDDLNMLIARADEALYAAKAAGRNHTMTESGSISEVEALSA
ncbi:MAG: sensor domain-containing diguanylate cyclase [Pseudomonadota bacterium]